MQRHQREKSVDLLNQTDMLSAFLGEPPAEDDWGNATYHGQSASHDFEEPAYLADNIEGDMAIPEPHPYIEPAPLQPYDSYASYDQDNLQAELVMLDPLIAPLHCVRYTNLLAVTLQLRVSLWTCQCEVAV